MVEAWRDEHGTTWELVSLDLGALDGPCLVRQGFSRTDWLDGDVREGVEIIARFEDPEDARGFLAEEGFFPCRPA
jgi:hypothetical protein